ncbi:MAG: LysR family transcriptional regulator [Pyrinomonadaceae bacterium]
MEIRQLKAFLAIAEAKTFTAGAKATGVTQAAISMQIRQLEEEVGLPLFTRTPRRILMTEAGEHLLERARTILREHDAALGELAELGGVEHGRLRIGSSSSTFSANQLPSILIEIRRQYANAQITVCAATSQRLVDMLTHGEIDIAFVSLPVENGMITAEKVFSDEIVAIAHPTHPRAKKRSITPADLAEQPLILGERGGNTRRLIDDFFENAGLKPNIIMELSRQEAVNEMVEANLGVGTAGAKTIANEIREGRLVAWTIEALKINWELGLARLVGGYYSPIAKEFVELCKVSFAQHEKALRAKR